MIDDKELPQETTAEEVPTEETLALVEEEYKDRWLRALADLENMRRRFDKEKEEIAAFALTRFAKDLLPVADNLERALETENSGDNSSSAFASLHQGVTLTQKELEKVLHKFGIERIDALNKPFDPHLHQAMLEEERTDCAPGIVLSILQQGYCLKGRLLRPALVSVSKKG